MTTTAENLGDSLEVVLDLRCDIGEGPIWDADSSTLTFVDQTPGRVYRFDPASRALSSFDIGQEIGAAIPRVGGGFILTSRDGLLEVRSGGGPAKLILPIDANNPDTRLNDAKCDRAGRLWTGTLSKSSKRRASALYRVDNNLAVTAVVYEVGISNGIAWSPDGTCMYYADSAAHGVDAFDFDMATGELSKRRRFIDIARSEGVPDGITIDSEGHLWVALYLGGAVRRYSPNGTWVGSINLPVICVTSCGFGGERLDDFYITTASHNMNRGSSPQSPTAGALYRCQLGVCGLPEPKFLC